MDSSSLQASRDGRKRRIRPALWLVRDYGALMTVLTIVTQRYFIEGVSFSGMGGR